MNVFEDLIEELKEDNLLEETVIEIKRAPHRETDRIASLPVKMTASTSNALACESSESKEFSTGNHPSASESVAESTLENSRKAAVDQVSGLQMVDHILAGIEREHMKMSPKSYDDLQVKKTLHSYLQLLGEPSAPGLPAAELAFMTEVANWFADLSGRDGNISVANVRRFCENSTPALSSQALIALARFYRNAPFTEAVRGKFDFVITRLFSREKGELRRTLLFGRDDMIGHIRSLYANWATLSIFSDGSDTERVSAAVERFRDVAREADAAVDFQHLISSDLFNRIRLLKEETAELFFEAEVTAAAIETNVRVGNRFVELAEKARDAESAGSIEEKYGYTYDTIVSSAASRTILLLDLLNGEPKVPTVAEASVEPAPTVETGASMPKVDFERAPQAEGSFFSNFTVNRWLALATVIVLALSVGVYLWSESVASADSGVEKANPVDLSSSDMKAHVREASVASETLYAVTEPTWDGLGEEEQKDFLRKSLAFAKSRNLKRVTLLNERGRTVGIASEHRLEVLPPQ